MEYRGDKILTITHLLGIEYPDLTVFAITFKHYVLIVFANEYESVRERVALPYTTLDKLDAVEIAKSINEDLKIIMKE